jgi:hypothetical protein
MTFPKRVYSHVVRVERVGRDSSATDKANRCFVAATVLRDDPTAANVVEIPSEEGKTLIAGKKDQLKAWLIQAQSVGLALDKAHGLHGHARQSFLLRWAEIGGIDLDENPVVRTVFPEVYGELNQARDNARVVLIRHNRVIRDMVKAGVA